MGTLLKGVAAAPGVGVGRVVFFDDSPRFIPTRTLQAEEVEGEVRRFRTALRSAEKDLRVLRRQVAQSLSRRDAAIFDAQIAILQDPGVVNDVRELIFLELINVEQALQRVVAKYEKAFEEVLDPAFKERAADIRDVGNRVLMVLLKRKRTRALQGGRFIHAALDFLPSRAGDLDRERCAAILTERGGKYSHGAILARSLGIPAVVGIDDLYGRLLEGQEVAVDGAAGLVYVGLDPEELREWRERETTFRAVEARLAEVRKHPSVTRDGERVSLEINIEGLRDLHGADLEACDGVGLFRTEFAFMEKRQFPSEDEQLEIYRETLRLAGGKPVTFRTLDVGGDKPLAYFRLPKESNPVLGWRGIRISFALMDLFYTQIRAILRASVEGPTSILLPMISTVDEVEKARAAIDQIRADLAKEKIPVARQVALGAMIEVPAAALSLREILEKVDFVSVGTNDLTQYLLAVDRDNPRVASFYDPYHPGVLRLLAEIGRTCVRAQRPGAICGEIAGDHFLTLTLLGLGFTTLSMAPVFLPRVKLMVTDATMAECRRQARNVLSLPTAGQVREFLKGEAKRRVQRYLKAHGLGAEGPAQG